MTERQSEKTKFKTSDIVEVGLMAALIFAGTYINIPFYIAGSRSMVHLGTIVMFICVLLLRAKKAAFASAIGLALYDGLSPYAIFAPFTFVIKGGMAYIAGVIAFRGKYNGNSIINNTFAFVAAGIFDIAGYFIADTIIYHSYVVAWAHVGSSVITTFIGIVIALPLGKIIKTALKR
ncbi:MAG: ECF transporter S component [Clostridium sp.]|nr:ECF transporter S component [Clostridium sp.]